MKRRLRLLLPSVLALSMGCMSLHAQQAIVLQQQMGAKDFAQAGLNKLQPAELAHLQQWLAAHAPELAAAVPASSVKSASVAANKTPAQSSGWFGKKSPSTSERARRIVINPIAGRFNGWQNGSILTLQNGQKWRVSDDSVLIVRAPMESPEVTVKPGAVGGWILKVKGYNTSARVQPAN
ncbi:MAG: hypothetical protein ABI114_00170 [Rhodanobacter sp.]